MELLVQTGPDSNNQWKRARTMRSRDLAWLAWQQMVSTQLWQSCSVSLLVTSVLLRFEVSDVPLQVRDLSAIGDRHASCQFTLSAVRQAPLFRLQSAGSVRQSIRFGKNGDRIWAEETAHSQFTQAGLSVSLILFIASHSPSVLVWSQLPLHDHYSKHTFIHLRGSMMGFP